MSKSASKALDLQQLFTWLLADGHISKADIKSYYNQAQGLLRNATVAMHPLAAVAQCKLHSNTTPPRLITLDWLTEWMAHKVNLPFFRIDPLKIDFTRVADVMSATYAARFNILPVELTPTGPELMVTTGLVASTVQVLLFEPVLPTESVPETVKVCEPSARPDTSNEPAQATAGCPSNWQVTVALGSSTVKARWALV